MGGRKWTECLPVCVTVFSALCVLTTRAQGGCSTNPCPATSYCFDGTATICVACNKACLSCKGPGADECLKCKTGYYKVLDTCTACPSGSHGENCNDTCHCLGVNECDPITGYCQGKCEKGYWTPPACQTVCPDLKYGLDCLQDCHCINDSVCDKVLGFCPNNICHPDWTSAGCNKRLPKLANPPEIIVSTCQYIIVRWSAWNAQTDFGDLPISEYRLYISTGSDLNTTWRSIANVTYSANVTSHNFNASGLLPDANYRFRVDVHYSDDGKTVEKTSLGLPSDLAHTTCTSTEVFVTVTADNNNNALQTTWNIAPGLSIYSWNITISYQRIGIGDCERVNESQVGPFLIGQGETAYSLSHPEVWSRYRFTLSARGIGVVSYITSTSSVEATSAEAAPVGVVSNFTTIRVNTTSVTLGWINVPCRQRGGQLTNFEVILKILNTTSVLKRLNSNVNSITISGLNATTYYTVSVRYINLAGAGNFSPDYVFRTLDNVTSRTTFAAVTETVLTNLTTTVQVSTPLRSGQVGQNVIVQNVTLQGGTNNTNGRVTVMINNTWGTVCDDSWDNLDAIVVCKMLGFTGGAAYGQAKYGQSTGPILMTNVSCTGSEAVLGDCGFVTGININCSHSEDASVECQVPIPVGQTTLAPVTTTKSGQTLPSNCTVQQSVVSLFGSQAGIGYVQIRAPNGTVGLVCQNGWDLNAARVVCRELCYDSALSLPEMKPEYQTRVPQNMSIILDDVSCTGTEMSLQICSHRAWFDTSCIFSEVASVSCVSSPYVTQPSKTFTNYIFSYPSTECAIAGVFTSFCICCI